MRTIQTVNRAAVVVRPKEPFLRWAASLDDSAPDQAEALRSQASVYLVPEDDDGEMPPIDAYAQEIFELELESWCTDENRWPATLDLTTFLAWFDITMESLVVDLGADEIVSEEL